ncbi:PilN domain-containing protein [Thermotalea metallivorans]|uniref:Fimbrial assembly protein PilN n=1 Tax=Thermotalea metallivorans TaxID=520762 RepID=A0A140L8A5_9FIRM|nr:PilN domain-containing protein [Thermotalea metallivorans]KXG76780.1 hypothetical protein AN619_07720 [Thermotalea metallivorans]
MRDFNFFSPYMTVEKASKGKERMIAAVVCTIAAVVISFSISNITKVKKLENEIAQLESFMTAPATTKKLKELNNKKEKIIVMEKYHQGIKQLNEQIEGTNPIDSLLLEQIALSFPQDIFIDMMSISQNDVQLRGVSRSHTAIAELVYNLKQLDVFKSVHVYMMNAESAESENQIYMLKCILK